MANVTMYAYANNRCPYCVAARRLLTAKGVAFDEITVDHNPEQRDIMVKRSGRNTLPQIFIDDVPIGGYDDMAALDKQGKLDAMLAL